ncbi:MAG: sensor domain-containing diguanylate cyclase [Solirubrobacteraceae bacterium]
MHEFGGDAAVSEVLSRAGITRPAAELTDIANWISYRDAVALWRAGAQVTHHPRFARAVGEDAARRLNSSPVAALLRSLGSPEAVYSQIAVAASKYSTVATLRAVRCGPGFADIVAEPTAGFSRAPDHCDWTCGLLSQPALLFGLAPATVEHERCAAFGAPACEYRVTWSADQARSDRESPEQTRQLREQLEAMTERLHSMFQTAADLIGPGRVEDVLARIADRAAVEVRAPRHLLAIQMPFESQPRVFHRGFGENDVSAHVEQLLSQHPAELPESCLVVPVRSNRHDYGRLLAMFEHGSFFPEERELLEVYARYAANALDSASALHEAERRYQQSSALLGLARALAAAGTSAEVARKLADSVPAVVDCDRVGVYLWDETRRELVRSATTQVNGEDPIQVAGRSSWTPTPGSALATMLRDPQPDPLFLDADTGDARLRELFASLGFVATILVPLVAPGRLLGLLSVAVTENPARLTPSADLLDRLSGVAAQATTTLQNGQLVDQITYQALHDQLTGLANRVQFTSMLRTAVLEAHDQSSLVTLFYVDLDRFKPVNDEFGHEIGDALLSAVGERLRACTRARDVVARLGGDEFAVLVTAGVGDNLDRVHARIEEAFVPPFVLGGRQIRLGASVGRAVYPRDAADADALLRHADAAMFESKRGRPDGDVLRLPGAVV